MAWQAKIQQVQYNPVFNDTVLLNVQFFDDQDSTKQFIKEYKLASQHFTDIGNFDGLIEQELQNLVLFDNTVEIIKQRAAASETIGMAKPILEVLKDVAVAPATIEKNQLPADQVLVSEVTAAPDLSELPPAKQPGGIKVSLDAEPKVG